MAAIIYYQNPCKLLISFRCIKAYMPAFSGRFSRESLQKGFLSNFMLVFLVLFLDFWTFSDPRKGYQGAIASCRCYACVFGFVIGFLDF